MGCMGFGDAGNGQHSWALDEEHSNIVLVHKFADCNKNGGLLWVKN